VRVTYRFHLDDARIGKARRFALTVDDVSYPHAPRLGERVLVPTRDLAETSGARQVTDVVYDPFGKVILDFHLDGLVNDVDSQVEVLRAAGYHELGSPAEE